MTERAPRQAGTRAMRPGLVLDTVRTYCGLALFGLMGLLWTPVALPLYYVLPARTGRAFGRALIRSAFRAYLATLRWSGACRFDLSALDSLRGQGPLIVAPNHPSLIDAPLVISRLPGLACVMKSGLLAHPALGAGARLARYIGNEDLLRMIELALAELRDGRQLLLFPEATRSSDDPIGPVRGMVGLISKRSGVAVQTVLLEADSPFLGKRWRLRDVPHLPITYRARLGRRFDPPTDAQAFIAELDAYFRQALEQAPTAESRPCGASRHDAHA